MFLRNCIGFLLNITVFKTVKLVYKFVHTGLSKYVAPYLSSNCSQSGGNFLAISKFYPSIYRSVKQFGYSFAFDAPTVSNNLPGEICASPSIASIRKQPKTYLYTKAYRI